MSTTYTVLLAERCDVSCDGGVILTQYYSQNSVMFVVAEEYYSQNGVMFVVTEEYYSHNGVMFDITDEYYLHSTTGRAV